MGTPALLQQGGHRRSELAQQLPCSSQTLLHTYRMLFVRLHVKDASCYILASSNELRRNDNINGKMLGDKAGHEFRLHDD
jgi:hypothetical protein